MSTLLQDLRHSARKLAHTPIFTLAAVSILAVGIGANAAVFSLVDAVLFRPPPFERPEEIVSIFQHSDDGFPSSTAYPAYRDMAAMVDVFAAVGAVSDANMRMETSEGLRELSIEFATAIR